MRKKCLRSTIDNATKEFVERSFIEHGCRYGYGVLTENAVRSILSHSSTSVVNFGKHRLNVLLCNSMRGICVLMLYVSFGYALKPFTNAMIKVRFWTGFHWRCLRMDCCHTKKNLCKGRIWMLDQSCELTPIRTYDISWDHCANVRNRKTRYLAECVFNW